MRFIAAAREWNAEHDDSLTTIALYTDADRHAMFTREAEVAYSIGAPTYVDAHGDRRVSYLDYGRLERALRATDADAVWVGWGFVAEHAAFADLCERMGVVFIGPDGAMMRALGDKITSKRLAERADVPVAPWSGGPVDTLEEARRHADRLGYPLMVKATAGGGGRGIRKVTGPDGLEDAFGTARSEAGKAFGDQTVFLERMVTGARHVEVQVIADRYGTTWTLGVRDCSVQRRNQKVFEETPSPALSREQHEELEAAAARLTREIGYQNAGTVEFLYDERSGSFSFMEVNARLQVEHPITEMITGVDLVKLQIDVARGERLAEKSPLKHGHSIEARLNAEDPESSFAPSPGRIERLRFATGPGIRIDTGVDEGDTVPAEFDSMIAKVIAVGRTRAEAVGRLRRALLSCSVEIEGGTTNKGFLLGLLDREEFAAAKFDVGWLDRLVVEGAHVSRDHAEVALVRAAIGIYDEQVRLERTRFLSSAARGRPEVGTERGCTAELRYLGRAYRLHVLQLGPTRYRVESDGQRIDVTLVRFERGDERLSVAGRTYGARLMDQGLSALVEVEGIPHRVSLDAGGVVRVPSPAIVVDVLVEPGDVVDAKTPLAVVEAMKMEMTVEAPFAGRVREVHVIRNVQVPAGTALVTMEPSAEGAAHASPKLDFSNITATTPKSALADLRSMLLGYDAVGAPPAFVEDPSLEDEALQIFVDVSALTRRWSEPEEPFDPRGHSAQEYLFSYLRDLNLRRGELPQSFLDKLRRALAHYGVERLDRSEALENALFRIFRSHTGVEEQVTPILRLLEARLGRELEPNAHNQNLLECLIRETRDTLPSIHDIARELHFRTFEKPIREKVAAETYREVERVLASPDLGDDDRIKALVDCPHPLKTLFSRRFENSSPKLCELMLEALTRRYYRIRVLENPVAFEVAGFRFFCARYHHDDVDIRVLSTHIDLEQIRKVGPALVEASKSCAAAERLVIDLYVQRYDETPDPEQTSRELAEVLDAVELTRPIRRVVVAISSDRDDLSISKVAHFTFRQRDGKFMEDRPYRGLHPMMSKRLSLWRLSNFDIERISSTEDVYLFRCVGKENRRDERLIALAEVRDLTPLRDDHGKIVALPVLEHALAEALAGIRRFQALRSERERLHWNRVMLYVWPPLDFTSEELNSLVHRMAPATHGLGLERVLVQGRFDGRERVLDVSNPGVGGLQITLRSVPEHPLKPLDSYTQKVVRLRRRGLTYPYEITKMLASSPDELKATFPPGQFEEYDLDDEHRLVRVDRPLGLNTANIVVGTITNFTSKVPEGMKRVILLGDPSRGMGSLAEPECRRINAALALAREERIPLEWFAVSAGAKISMESGVENMDWIASVLRELVLFTQDGGEVNILVCGINVGAQPYWNAEATMLMHTRGILVMVKGSAMVLTGKEALDYSGGVSAEDNEGIGGFDRIMGPNGQAQYVAHDIAEACRILLAHYDHTYVVPGERCPRRATTNDPVARDVGSYSHPHLEGAPFDSVGEVFSDATNPGRKKPFDIRAVMRAAVDQDHDPLERWRAMRGAETAVVWDAHLGGYPVCLVGIESHPVPRFGAIPADGPATWTSGTLFPASSKKVARAINAASGNRPVVMLANLSGFDGSPESMRHWQLEYGAEIGRAVVNFQGPSVFCVVSRYHGGAFVVFSNRLNPRLEVAALEGTFASVIGGAPAAAVVFARELEKRTRADGRILEIQDAIQRADTLRRVGLREKLAGTTKTVRTEKLREVAAEFDGIHSIHRAQKVGAVHRIIPADRLRPYLVDAVERGLSR